MKGIGRNTLNVEITKIDNFVCPACGEVIPQVAARDGVIKGWCPHAKKEIKVTISSKKEEPKKPEVTKSISTLDTLTQQRAKVLKDLVSAREDGDLKENTAYQAASEQLTILDAKIQLEEELAKRSGKKA